ncbi:hypothetical protein PHLH3_30590 [Pseudomonas sp. St386]|nr:hypothetical protein PFLU4_13280 [Pseudomonas fluorescens]RDI04753.1 hypothetical protein DFO59_10475 [Pseudomonas fluorescens]UII18071.1 hypothetical protein LRP86_04995 [Pseudomonas brassicacearum]BBP53433.1 hypothetical protein PHLH3_30590 [Pseudomonas sp. St386]SDP47474.1 hypothetical protein SAMN04490180_1507 [Pseudomonas brassicacearum]
MDRRGIKRPRKHSLTAKVSSSYGQEDACVDYLGWVQWPAMLVTVLAAWLIGSRQPRRRVAGFSCFIASNILWVIWGLHTHAYALIVLQFCLCAMNLRGFKKNTE